MGFISEGQNWNNNLHCHWNDITFQYQLFVNYEWIVIWLVGIRICFGNLSMYPIPLRSHQMNKYQLPSHIYFRFIGYAYVPKWITHHKCSTPHFITTTTKINQFHLILTIQRHIFSLSISMDHIEIIQILLWFSHENGNVPGW